MNAQELIFSLELTQSDKKNIKLEKTLLLVRIYVFH